MKLIQGVLFVFFFLFVVCIFYRCLIFDEMIGEYRIYWVDGFMIQDYCLLISLVNDLVYDIKLWERKSFLEFLEKVYYDGLCFYYWDMVYIFIKCVMSGIEIYWVNRCWVICDKNFCIWYILKLSSIGFVMFDLLVE